MRFELHPLCALFPRMVGAEFEALKADIKANGLRQPIVTHQGMILDGGNRYEACMAVGVKPLMTEYTGTNLATYVLSANLHRRHLSPGQQAAIVASAQDWATAHKQGGTGANQHGKEQTGNVAGLQTVAQRAAASGASDRTQRMADKLAKDAPDLAVQVAHGEISLPKAAAKSRPAKPAKATKKAKPAKQAPAMEPVVDPVLVAKLDDAQQAVEILSEDNDRLNDRLAVAAMQATEEERAAAAETIADLRAQIKTLTAELNAVKASRDGYMRENSELKSQCSRQKKQLDKLRVAA